MARDDSAPLTSFIQSPQVADGEAGSRQNGLTQLSRHVPL